MAIEIGDCYLNDETDRLKRHLWVVISYPEIDPENVLIVNVNTWKDYHDQSCVFVGGEHPRINHKSFVNYGEAKVTSVAALTAIINLRRVSCQECVTQEVMERILQGAQDSDELKGVHRRLLRIQGLVE